jgi:hypothetical protein
LTCEICPGRDDNRLSFFGLILISSKDLKLNVQQGPTAAQTETLRAGLTFKARNCHPQWRDPARRVAQPKDLSSVVSSLSPSIIRI